MVFDVNSNFIACYGQSKVYIIKLLTVEKEVGFEHECIIDPSYERILNVKIVSQNESIFKCFASCKVRGQRNVVFVDIHSDS